MYDWSKNTIDWDHIKVGFSVAAISANSELAPDFERRMEDDADAGVLGSSRDDIGFSQIYKFPRIPRPQFRLGQFRFVRPLGQLEFILPHKA